MISVCQEDGWGDFQEFCSPPARATHLLSWASWQLYSHGRAAELWVRFPQNFLEFGVLSSIRNSSNKYQRKETPENKWHNSGSETCNFTPASVTFHIISISSLFRWVMTLLGGWWSPLHLNCNGHSPLLASVKFSFRAYSLASLVLMAGHIISMFYLLIYLGQTHLWCVR